VAGSPHPREERSFSPQDHDDARGKERSFSRLRHNDEGGTSEGRSEKERSFYSPNRGDQDEEERSFSLESGEDMLVCTKVGHPTTNGEELAGSLSPAHIARGFAASRERLGRVDLYMIHHVEDGATPIVATVEALAGLRAEGQIRAYGVCNVSAPELERILAAADRLGVARPGWVQNGFSLARRGDEKELLPLVREEGLGYTPFSPLAGGVLSDRYLDGRAPGDGSRIALLGEEYPYRPDVLERVARLARVAAARGVSTAGLALAWLLHHDAVTAPLVAPRTTAQWDAVDEALAQPLDDATAGEIGELFA
jgi:1-deoxyxylulose-5-phosphate synthase